MVSFLHLFTANLRTFLGLFALETRMANDVIKAVDPAVMTNSCRPKLGLPKSVTNQNLSF